MPDEIPAKPRSETTTATAWFSLLFMLGVFYLLSVGPVAAVTAQARVGEKAVSVIYAPIAWMYKHTLLRRPLQWYVKLWGLKVDD